MAGLVPNRLVWFGLLGYAVSGAGFSISISQICLGLALIGLLWQRFRTGAPGWRPAPWFDAYMFFAFIGLLSLSWSVDLRRSIDESRKFLMILVMLVPFLARLHPHRAETVLLALIGGTGVAGWIGTAQLALRLGVPENRHRAYGFFSLPLTFGEIMALMIVLTIASRPLWRGQPRRGWVASLALGGQFAGLIASLSRGVWLGLAAGGVGLLLAGRTWGEIRRYLLVAVMVAIAIGSVVAFTPFGQRLVDPDLLAYSSFFRLRIWQIGATILADHPFGVGMNNVKPLYPLHADQLDRHFGELQGHLHNNFLHYAAMLGWPGLAMFVWFWLELLWELRRRADPDQGGSARWRRFLTRMPAFWAAFFAIGLTEYAYGDEEVCMLFFFVIGLVFSPVGGMVRTDERPTAAPPAATAV